MQCVDPQEYDHLEIPFDIFKSFIIGFYGMTEYTDQKIYEKNISDKKKVIIDCDNPNNFAKICKQKGSTVLCTMSVDVNQDGFITNISVGDNIVRNLRLFFFKFMSRHGDKYNRACLYNSIYVLRRFIEFNYSIIGINFNGDTFNEINEACNNINIRRDIIKNLSGQKEQEECELRF